MAGTGKTAITYTFSRLLVSKKSVAATFFCSRSTKCTDVRRIFPTIAWIMAQTYSLYRAALVEALQSNVDAQAGSLEHQFKKLLLCPLQSINPDSIPTGIIVIDALDECESDEAIGCSGSLDAFRLPLIAATGHIKLTPTTLTLRRRTQIHN
jgi:hypothetical protein